MPDMLQGPGSASAEGEKRRRTDQDAQAGTPLQSQARTLSNVIAASENNYTRLPKIPLLAFYLREKTDAVHAESCVGSWYGSLV